MTEPGPHCPNCESDDVDECESRSFGTTVIKCSTCGKSIEIAWMQDVVESDFDDE